MTALPHLRIGPGGALYVRAPGEARPGRPVGGGFGSGPLAPGRRAQMAGPVTVSLINNNVSAWGLGCDGEPREIERIATRAVAWARHGWDPETMQAWAAVGAEDFAAAAPWLMLGATPSDMAEVRTVEGWLFVTAADMPRCVAWARLSAVCTPEFAAAGAAQGQGPRAVRLLARALDEAERNQFRGLFATRRTLTREGVLVPLPWTEPEGEDRTAYAQTLAGVDWADVAVCLRAGLGRDEAAQHLRDGGNVEAALLVAALH